MSVLRAQQSPKKTPYRRTLLLLLSAAVFISAFATGGFCLRASATSTPPDKARVFAYGTDPCTVYVANSIRDDKVNATYRVYADSSRTVLLGEAYADLYASTYCVIPLAYRPSTAYVTRQEADQPESANTAVTVGRTPSIQLKMREVRDATQTIPTVYGASDSPYFLGKYMLPAPGNLTQLTEGKYYQVEILLNNFTGIDTVQVPLRYDTELLEPARASGTKLAATTSALMSAASSGRWLSSTSDLSQYGVLKGTSFSTWSTGAGFSGGDGGTYQYLNTTTGLFKLQANTASTALPASFGTGETVSGSTEKKTPEFLRFFFRAKQTADISTLPVWFATEADCPEEAKGTPVAETYYDILSPNGISATLCGANVMAPPPVLKTVGTDTAAVLSLSASDMQALPDTYYNKMSTLSVLSADEVKIYNYTNWHKDGEEFSRFTLDGDPSIDIHDSLVISAGCTSIKNGDEIRVYQSLPVQYDSPYKSGTYQANQGVKIDLGSAFLNPDGGTVYVSIVRKDASGNIGYQSNAVDCPVSYPAEASRDVTFRIYRGGWTDETRPSEPYGAQNGKKPTGDTGTRTGTPLQDVERGERLQIRVYFNNFYELMSYGFAIRFDPGYVSVADVDYGPVTTGTVFEQVYRNEKSCFSVGKDLANVTLTEQAIYQAWQDQNEEEISALMATLGIATRAEFDQRAADVQVKYAAGVTEDGTNTLPWKGGLLFNDRDDETGFPYVDCTNGVIRFVSATLEQTPLTLHRADGGYHFISINFVAEMDGDPGFRLVELGDAGYELLPGQEIVLVGGQTGLKAQTNWEVWPMGNRVEMSLRNGNALASDNDLYAEYLFDGASYRDPGYEVRRADGSRIPTADIARWYVEEDETGNETIHDLAWSENEAITAFRIAADKYSAHYVLYYKYVTQDGTDQTVQAERNIYIIYRKGDVNRDGRIDLFDEQALADHLNADLLSDYVKNALLCAEPDLEPSYQMYAKKTADIDGDGEIGKADREALRDHNLGCVLIEQDYIMPVS